MIRVFARRPAHIGQRIHRHARLRLLLHHDLSGHLAKADVAALIAPHAREQRTHVLGAAGLVVADVVAAAVALDALPLRAARRLRELPDLLHRHALHDDDIGLRLRPAAGRVAENHVCVHDCFGYDVARHAAEPAALLRVPPEIQRHIAVYVGVAQQLAVLVADLLPLDHAVDALLEHLRRLLGNHVRKKGLDVLPHVVTHDLRHLVVRDLADEIHGDRPHLLCLNARPLVALVEALAGLDLLIEVQPAVIAHPAAVLRLHRLRGDRFIHRSSPPVSQSGPAAPHSCRCKP